jgi:tRNA A-37 threonylcarbamoyl transferase component Bud32
MEYLRGLSLAELVERFGPLLPRAVYLLRQVCQSLREAHRAGLIHRDIKSSNIDAESLELALAECVCSEDWDQDLAAGWWRGAAAVLPTTA